MSPTPFKDQFVDFVVELTLCFDLCRAIRANRRLPPTTDALDTLEASIEAAVKGLQREFNLLRRAVGSRMDLGNEKARLSLQKNIRELQSKIKARLYAVAHKRNHSELPGFRNIYKDWIKIEESVSKTISLLGENLELEKAQPASIMSESKRKTDEVIMTVKEFHRMKDHMRNSWVEKLVAGRLVYVNCLDENKVMTERPEGFVQFLPRLESRTKSWEREELPRKVTFRKDSWNTRGEW